MSTGIPWEAIVTIVLFMTVHLVGTVWWMSKIQTMLQILNATVDSIGKAILRHEAAYYHKEDAIRELARIEQQMQAMWKRIDEIKEK